MAELFKQDPYMTTGAVIGVIFRSKGHYWSTAQEAAIGEHRTGATFSRRRHINSNWQGSAAQNKAKKNTSFNCLFWVQLGSDVYIHR